MGGNYNLFLDKQISKKGYLGDKINEEKGNASAINEFIEKIEADKDKQARKQHTGKKKSVKALPKLVAVKESATPLNVSVRLATFTLVNVLKNQGLFYQALEVLDLLEEKGEDPDMIRLERDAVKTLIESLQKDLE